MIVIGSGKWARVVTDKLNLLKDIQTTVVGNDTTFADLNRRDIIQCPRGSAVLILSKTSQHLEDLVLSMLLNPKLIFVEKGFSNEQEMQIAKECLGNVPGFILSQYRFSNVFNLLKNISSEVIIKINYFWTIEKGEPKEWAYHILSIDNFIKKIKNPNNIDTFGFYKLDSISDVIIKQGSSRKLSTEISTQENVYYIDLGVTNRITKVNKATREVSEQEFINEDCLMHQLQSIFQDNNVSRLEGI